MIQFRWLRLRGLAVLAMCCGGGYAAAQQPASTSPPAASDVAARIGDQVITLSQVDEKGMATDAKAYQALYDARRRALEELIADALLTQEASQRGITKEALVAQEIDAKIQPVTDAEVQAYYDSNKARMRNPEFAQVAEPIRQFLQTQRETSVRGLFIESLKKKANVQVALEPPRVDVQIAQNDPTMGPANAPVTIVEFVDFQ